MKIKSPLINKNEVKLLCEAGADEFFCGIEPYGWRRKYKDFFINQRSTGANFTKLNDLEEAISIAHKYKTKVHIAVNAFFYLEEQYKKVEQVIKYVLDMGADGIIFADPALLLNMDDGLLKAKDVVIGCDAVVLNSGAVDFYKQLGATRVVFPRAMTLEEMQEAINSRPAMEYEVFIIHDLCFFVDGFCTYCKEATGIMRQEGRGRNNVYFFSASRIPGRGFVGCCRTRFQRQRISVKSNKPLGRIRAFTFWMKKHIEGCGACAMYDLKRMGVTSLKVLDRSLPIKERVKATRFIRECLDGLKDNKLSRSDYFDYCKRCFKEAFKLRCGKFDCYYPSVFLSG